MTSRSITPAFPRTLCEAELRQTAGGAIYMKVDGIAGRVTAEGSAHSGGVNVCFGDGSVRF